MKTQHTFTMKLLLSVLILCFSIQMKSQGQYCLNLAGEDQIDAFAHRNDAEEATPKIALFTTNIKFKPNTNLNSLAVQIKTVALCMLQLDAIKHQTTLVSQGKCNTGYLTGVNVILGMNESTKKIELYYRPIVMCFLGTYQSNVGGSSCSFATYTVHYTANYYAYVSNTFVIIPEASVLASASVYTSNVKITHYAGDPDPTFHLPDPAKDVTGDVNSAIFSFKEIDDLIKSNSTDEIKIWNEYNIVDTKISGVMKKVGRHSLIFSDKNSDGVSTFLPGGYMSAEFAIPKNISHLQKSKEEFMAAYANLAHLCPPNCNVISYRRSCP